MEESKPRNNLYLLSRPDEEVGYGECVAYIVSAPNEEFAKYIYPCKGVGWHQKSRRWAKSLPNGGNDSEWMDHEWIPAYDVVVKKIGTTHRTKKIVFLSSYKNG